MANLTCYAAPLGGCSGVLSGEHWFSKSVLRALGVTQWFVVENFNGLPTKYRTTINSERAAPKVLCEGHNNMLSGLDEQAKEMATWLRDANQWLENGGNAPPETEVDGRKIERWLLKVYLGFAAAGFAVEGSSASNNVNVTLPLLDWAFNGVRPNHERKVFVVKGPTAQLNRHEIGIAPMAVGALCMFTLLGIEFGLIVADQAPVAPLGPGVCCLLEPGGIRAVRGAAQEGPLLAIRWDGPDHTVIKFGALPTTEEPRSPVP